jgi:hypothetical protein
MMSLIGMVLHFVISRSAAKFSMDELQTRLKLSSAEVAERIGKASDTPTNHGLASHLIGIERWGQRRLRSVLGEALEMGEYDQDRPNSDIPLKNLRDLFVETRQQTLALIKELKKVPGIENKMIVHNDIGSLSVRGWLFYLDSHANRESQNIK